MPLSDQQTTLAEIKTIIEQFVDQRDWQQFHSPKNISMALAIEAAELMEHFQWLTNDASENLEDDQLVKVGEEMADVFCYTLAMANTLKIDLAATFERKMQMNREKYPAEKFKGRFGPDDPNPVSE